MPLPPDGATATPFAATFAPATAVPASMAAAYGAVTGSPQPGAGFMPPTPPAPNARTLHEQEIAMIQAALDAAGGNISEASKRLGISRNTIYRKLRWNRPDNDAA
jgi:transcriptional regulator of acetoin/glycerol metabolism